MPFPRIRTTFAACVVASLLCTSTSALAQSPEEGLRAALAEQNAWLGQAPSGNAWQSQLLNDQLQAQLARGPHADPIALAQVAARYQSDIPGLELAPFRKVRQALVAWMRSLPPPPADQLPAMARNSKQVFLPYTKDDVAAAKALLVAAVARLQPQLQAAGANGAAWREFLMLDKLEQETAKTDGTDLPTLDAVFQRFASGQEGLQINYFADVRRGLRRYLATARALNQPQLREQYQKILDKLADSLQTYVKAPTAESVQDINLILDWLDHAGQAPWLVSAIRQRLSHPNLYVQASERLVASRLEGPVTNVSPVTDCILGTTIYGTGHTNGQLSVQFVPSSDSAIIDAIFQGTVNTNTIGYNGPVTIYSTGATGIGARKRLIIGELQASALPTQTSAVTSTQINDIQANLGLIERIAWRKAMQQKAEAEAIAAQHAEQQFSARLDQQADPVIAKANATIEQKGRIPLAGRNLLPEVFRVSTTDDDIRLVIQEEGGQLAAPGAPPELGPDSDVAVRVHESVINNLTFAGLGGITLDSKRFQELLTKQFGLPERIQTDGEEEPWSITFPERQPVQVTFADNGFSVTISGRKYMNEGNEYPGMNVTAVYRIQKTDRGLRAIRQGRLRIFPPGFSPDSGQQLSARQQVLRNVLEPRFGRFLTEELAPQNIVLKQQAEQQEQPESGGVQAAPRPPVELALTRWDTSNGWLVMAWKMVPPSAATLSGAMPAESKPATPPAPETKPAAPPAAPTTPPAKPAAPPAPEPKPVAPPAKPSAPPSPEAKPATPPVATPATPPATPAVPGK